MNKGAQCELKIYSGRAELELAISNGNCSLDIFRRLLQDFPNKQTRTRCIWLIGGGTRGKTVEFIQELVSAEVSLEARDRYGRTPLTAHVRDEGIFESLLKCGSQLDAVDSQGQGCLQQFVSTPGSYNSVERLRKLVEIGLNPLSLDINGNNLLHVAAYHYRGTSEDVTFIQQLIDFGISVNSKNNLGATPLHLHIEYGRVGSSDNQKTRARLLELS